MIGHATIDPLTEQILATYNDHEAKALEDIYRKRIDSLLDHWEHTAYAILQSPISDRMRLQRPLDSIPLWCQNK